MAEKDFPASAGIPEGALIQKNSSGTSYVFFPSYYYDQDSKTKYKSKAKRLYIGKLVDGKFVPNKVFRENPGLVREDARRTFVLTPLDKEQEPASRSAVPPAGRTGTGDREIDFMEISKKRRTVRRFAPTPVEEEKLAKILEAGRWSPTAVNAQPQRVLVLDTPESLAKVREFCSFGFDQKYVDLSKECDDREHGKINLYYGAPLVLFICWDENECWKHPVSGRSSGATDATIVAIHMMLEAASIGLGTVWISFFDEDRARELLCIPESWKPACMIYIGYPADDFVPNTHLGGHRKPLAETCFRNSPEAPWRNTAE